MQNSMEYRPNFTERNLNFTKYWFAYFWLIETNPSEYGLLTIYFVDLSFNWMVGIL